MALLLNLLRRLDPGCASDETVAWRGATAVSWSEFNRRVGSWTALLSEMPGQSFALFHSDAFEFAAALFGAWLARKTIYLPGDNLPGTCAGLRANVSGFVGEFSDEWQPQAVLPSTCKFWSAGAGAGRARVLLRRDEVLRARADFPDADRV